MIKQMCYWMFLAFPHANRICQLHDFLPPEGEVLNYLAKTLCETIANVLKYNDLHRHIIYQNDPMAKPDFMVMVPDLYRRRRRRQARRRVPRHPPDPQGHLKNVFCPDIIY